MSKFELPTFVIETGKYEHFYLCSDVIPLNFFLCCHPVCVNLTLSHWLHLRGSRWKSGKDETPQEEEKKKKKTDKGKDKDKKTDKSNDKEETKVLLPAPQKLLTFADRAYRYAKAWPRN